MYGQKLLNNKKKKVRYILNNPPIKAISKGCYIVVGTTLLYNHNVYVNTLSQLMLYTKRIFPKVKKKINDSSKNVVYFESNI